MKARRHTRLDHLARFERAVTNGAWHSLLERLLFLVLWELPVERQLALPQSLLRRVLLRFEARPPNLGSLRDWLERTCKGEPVDLVEISEFRPTFDAASPDKADVFLYSAVAHICEGGAADAAPETVTSAAIAATSQAIGALSAQAWIDDDPEAAADENRLQEWMATRKSELEPCPVQLQRPMALNGAAMDAEDKAWDDVVAWLYAANLGQYPEVRNRSYLAKTILRSYGDFFLVLYPGKPIYRAPPTRAFLRGHRR